MSYCELVEIRKGKASGGFEFMNSRGGSARIWASLYNRYLLNPEIPYDGWINDRSNRLWRLANDSQIWFGDRAVLASTFDYALVFQEDFKRHAFNLRSFASRFPSGRCVCHLIEWAKVYESSPAQAIGIYGTSVGDNLWQPWDEELDESVPYDLVTGDRHLDIYKELDQ